MSDRPALFNSDTARRILERLSALERSSQNSLLGGGHNQSFPQLPLVSRWGITTTNEEYPVYPTSGNAVAVALIDVDPSPLYPGSTPTLNTTSPSNPTTVIATGWQSPLPFYGQLVGLIWRSGKWFYVWPDLWRATAGSTISAGSSGSVSLYQGSTNLGTRTAYFTWGDSGKPDIANGDEIWIKWFDAEQRYVIIPPGGGSGTTTPFAVMFNGNAYNGDGSNKNRIKRYPTGASSSNRVCYIHFINGWGDFASTGVTMMATASSVGGGTHANTDPSFKLTTTGLFRFDVFFRITDLTIYPTAATDTLTTSLPNTGAAHFHTVDVERNRYYSYYDYVRLQWRNTGTSTWQTTTERMSHDLPKIIKHSRSVDSSVDIADCSCTFWQNHNSANREYRLLIGSDWGYDSDTTTGEYAEQAVEADSGLICVTKLASYTADLTLSY